MIPRVSFRSSALLAATFAAAAGVAAWWWTHPPPAAAIRAEHAPLVSVQRRGLDGTVERWKLTDARGRSAEALWRPSPVDAPDTWTVVLMGGLDTGASAVRLVPDSLPVHVLAMDWPWDGPRHLTWLQFLARVPRIRESLLRSPAVLALGVEAARLEFPDSRIALMGVSLGVPPAAAALRLVHPEVAMFADGGADLAVQLESDVRHTLPWPLSSGPCARALGRLGARLLEPLDPARHADAAPGVPVLLLEASQDQRIPDHCRERLRAAFPHATVRVHARDHVRGRQNAATQAITMDAWAWLETRPE